MKCKYPRKHISHLSWVFTHSQKKQVLALFFRMPQDCGLQKKKQGISQCVYIYICCICQLSITSELRPSYCKGLEIWQDIVVSIGFSQKLTGFATIVGYLIGAAGTTRMCWISYIMLYHTCTGERIESRPICCRTSLTLHSPFNSIKMSKTCFAESMISYRSIYSKLVASPGKFHPVAGITLNHMLVTGSAP